MTKGQLEALISNKMVAFQREQLGRGAEGARTYISNDMIVIRMNKALTPAEKQLALTKQGQGLIKEMRIQLESIIRPKLEELMENLTGAKVISIHNDISTKTGERIDMFIFNCNLEEQLKLD